MNNTLKSVFAVVAVYIVLSFYLSPGTDRLNRETLPQQKTTSTWSGTAFFINHQGYIATAEHVVGEGKYFRVYYKHKFYPARVVGVDATNDVAILKTNIRVKDPLILTTSMNQRAAVGIYGYPGGTLVLTMTTGTMSYGGFIGASVYTQARSCHGNSGGPIINQNGLVVGQLNWAFALPSDLCSTSGGGAPSKYLIKLANKHGVLVYTSLPRYLTSFEEIYNMYRDEIVYIQGSK